MTWRVFIGTVVAVGTLTPAPERLHAHRRYCVRRKGVTYTATFAERHDVAHRPEDA